MHSIGKLDKEIYKCITSDIVTDEVIITDDRLRHILGRHPEAYERVVCSLKNVVENPDFIIADKHKATGLVIKEVELNGEYVQLVLRICTSEDEPGYKNSIISCWQISEKRLKNYLRNKQILYKKK